MLEPKNFIEANKDDHWVKAMNEELDQIEKKQYMGDGSKTRR
jgi:hypothetical protein